VAENRSEELPSYLSYLYKAATQPTPRAPIQLQGAIEPGTIDPRIRPQTNNPDGSYSTVRSMSFRDKDGNVVLVPTVLNNGTIGSNKEAVDQYYKTGQHLGKFANDADATEASYYLHEQLAKEYADRYGELDANPLVPRTQAPDIGSTAGYTNGYNGAPRQAGAQMLTGSQYQALINALAPPYRK
jgi:hypothetical protein